MKTLTATEKKVFEAVLDNLTNITRDTKYNAHEIIPKHIWNAEPKARHRHTGRVLSQLVDKGVLPFKKVKTESCNWLAYVLDL